MSVHLALLFTCILTHGYVPDAFIKTSITPILKNKNSDTSAFFLSKIMGAYLFTSDNQFGFKRKHSTHLCICTVKSIIRYCNYYNSAVYICFLVASKAFDRINHWTMFKKLILRDVPIIIVRVLCFWYSMQELCIQWGNMRSSFFNISNRVRQSGILFPKLFFVNIDDLSNVLISSGVGCFLNNVCINHDLCLMAPCAIALQELLNICHRYSITADLNFNAMKSFCVAFTPKSFKLSFLKLYINTAPIPYTDSLRYLEFIFTSNHRGGSDMLQQMRMLYARSNRLVRVFYFCSGNVLIELSKNFCGSFYCIYLLTHYNNASFSKIRVAYNDLIVS